MWRGPSVFILPAQSTYGLAIWAPATNSRRDLLISRSTLRTHLRSNSLPERRQCRSIGSPTGRSPGSMARARGHWRGRGFLNHPRATTFSKTALARLASVPFRKYPRIYPIRCCHAGGRGPSPVGWNTAARVVGSRRVPLPSPGGLARWRILTRAGGRPHTFAARKYQSIKLPPSFIIVARQPLNRRDAERRRRRAR